MLDSDSEIRFRELTHCLAAQRLAFFIGAGLSIPCGKPGWRKFLESCAPNAAVRTQLEALLEKDGYEEAATSLLDALGESAFDEAFRIAFGPFDADTEPPRGPVRLVPKLVAFARCAVVATTNFDRNLEASFKLQRLGPYETVHGGDGERLRNLYDTGTLALWKPHGEYLSRTHRVLTSADYQRAYGGKTAGEIDDRLPLPSSLFDFFTRHTVLFLGCSLGADRTLAVLERLHGKSLARHYAILEDTETVPRAERDRWLLDRSIHAIWYQKGAHDRVEELLKRLHVAATGSRVDALRPAWSESAVGKGHGQSWLERDKLSDEDFTSEDAIPPPQLDSALAALGDGHIVISGSPGSGKSAFAAWLQRKLVDRGDIPFVWPAEVSHPATLCKCVRELQTSYFGILDDVHLMREDVARLLDDECAAKHRFVILGRPDVFESGALESRVRALKRFTLDEDIASVARAMALHRAAADVDALLKEAGDDSVLMKMLLLARSATRESEVSRAAVMKYMQGRLDQMWEQKGAELVRLYLVLGCFRVLELPCSLQALHAQFGFRHEVIRHIVEREQLARHIDGKILLVEHARRAELYLIAVNGMTFINAAVLDATRSHARVTDVGVQGTQLWSLVLAIVFGRIVVFGEGAGPGRSDLKIADIVDRLLYGAHTEKRPYGGIETDWRAIADIAPELELSQGGRVTEATEVRRLELTYAIANGLRRRCGGAVAQGTLAELRKRLRLTDIPDQSFERKGYILYQQAYVAWMSNEFSRAIEIFGQSAAIDEIYAQQVVADTARCALHRAKAIMSRIACVRMQVETFVMHALGGTCAPAECMHPAESVKHFNDFIGQLRACKPLVDQDGHKEVDRFMRNGLFHLGQALAWLGEREAALRAECEANAIKGKPAAHASSLLRGELAFAEGCYGQVLQEINDTAILMRDEKSGETSGLRAQLCAQAAWRLGDSEQYRYWCEWLAKVCPREAGNAPAVDWARAAL